MGEEAGKFLDACPECGCREMFVRRRFPQKLGLGLVIGAAVAFLVLAARPRTFYIGAWILAGMVVVDVILAMVVGRVTVCYRCRREYPQVGINPAHGGFDLATAEKYRTGA